jgi:hypothetical protein
VSLLVLELPRVELHREPAASPVLVRPAVEVDAFVKFDGPPFDAEDDPWPVGIVLRDREAIRVHEHMFARSGIARGCGSVPPRTEPSNRYTGHHAPGSDTPCIDTLVLRRDLPS